MLPCCCNPPALPAAGLALLAAALPAAADVSRPGGAGHALLFADHGVLIEGFKDLGESAAAALTSARWPQRPRQRRRSLRPRSRLALNLPSAAPAPAPRPLQPLTPLRLRRGCPRLTGATPRPSYRTRCPPPHRTRTSRPLRPTIWYCSTPHASCCATRLSTVSGAAAGRGRGGQGAGTLAGAHRHAAPSLSGAPCHPHALSRPMARSRGLLLLRRVEQERQ